MCHDVFVDVLTNSALPSCPTYSPPFSYRAKIFGLIAC